MTDQLYRKNEDGALEEVEPSNTLYRRNQDGMMESVVPEAQGKAAAHDRLMAQGGKTNKQGKFTQGRLKGLTYDQAKQKFEGMWASAPEQLKEGYAEHARSGATASEKKVANDRRVASIQPAPATVRPALSPQQSRMKMYEDQKVSRIRQTGGDAGVAEYKRRTAARPAHDQDGNGVPDMIQRPQSSAQAQAPGNSFADPTKQPVTPVGGAQSVGDGSSAANGYQPQQTAFQAKMAENRTMSATPAMPPQPVNPAPAYSSEINAAGEKAFPGIQAQINSSPRTMSATPAMSPAQMDAADTKRALDQYAASPLAPKLLPQDNSTPIGRMASSAYQGASDMVDSAARAISKPLVNDATYAAGSKSIDDGRATRTAQELAANQARQKQVNGILGVTPPVTAALPAPPPTTTPSPQARPFVGPPAPQMSATPAPESRVNPLTGLPMGYRSGDSVSSQYQGKADESVARQKSAQDAAIASAPRAVPVASPNALVDQHAAAAASYKQDLDPAKAAQADAIYAGGTDLQKAKMVGNTLKRVAGVTAATRPQFAATRATPPPQPRRSLMPGLSPPRFAMSR